MSCDTEIGQLDQSFLCSEDVGTFDIAMDDTLFVEEDQSMKYLSNIQRHKILRKLAKVFAYLMERALFAVLQDNVQTVSRLDEAMIFDDIWVIQVLQQVDLLHDDIEFAFGEVGEEDLLNGDGFACGPIESAIHAAECTSSKDLAELL